MEFEMLNLGVAMAFSYIVILEILDEAIWANI